MNNEDLRVVCDQCGGTFIQHRRKHDLPIRQVKLSEWVSEDRAPKGEVSVLQPVEMVAECAACHFTVEYKVMSS